MTGEDLPPIRIRYRRLKSGVAGHDLAAELGRIAGLDTDALRSLWLRMTGKPPSRQLSGDLLRRMVMHRVQERCLVALDRKLATMLDRLADGGRVTPARLKIGSVLVREHGGVVHQVIVVQDGFAWNDRIFSSLSAAARAITGTKWNGHRFFGLRKAMTEDLETRDVGEAEAVRTKGRIARSVIDDAAGSRPRLAVATP